MSLSSRVKMKIPINSVIWAMLGLLTARHVESLSHTHRAYTGTNPEFAIALYSALANTNLTNILFSPFSLHVILGLAYAGAGGNTSKQIATGLHLPDKIKYVKRAFKHVLEKIDEHDLKIDMTLEIASKIFIAEQFQVNDKFHETVENDFLSELQGVEFTSADTVGIINKWIANKTDNHINSLFENNGLSADMKLLFVNTIYFSGKWLIEFHEDRTTSQPFYLNENTTKNVQMMYLKSYLQVVTNKRIDADILEIRYNDHYFSFMVILPRKIDGLAELERKLNPTLLKRLMRSLNKFQDVEVSIPKFKLEETTPLKDVLKSLGIVDMFDSDRANFSAMANASLHVGQVLHKATIEVNEYGIVAPSTIPSKRMFKVPTRKFVADHPFLFVVQSRLDKTVLFMGRLTDPN